jgi:hypothetical protein
LSLFDAYIQKLFRNKKKARAWHFQEICFFNFCLGVCVVAMNNMSRGRCVILFLWGVVTFVVLPIVCMAIGTFDWSVPREACPSRYGAPTPQQWLIVAAVLPWSMLVCTFFSMCIKDCGEHPSPSIFIRGSTALMLMMAIFSIVIVLWNILGGSLIVPTANWTCQPIQTSIIVSLCISWYIGSACVGGMLWLSDLRRARVSQTSATPSNALVSTSPVIIMDVASQRYLA